MNRRGDGVRGIADIFEKHGIERRTSESKNWLGDAGARSLDGDVVVFLKVDAGVLLGLGGFAIELFFETSVAPARDVLAIAPGTITEGRCRARIVRTTTAVRARPLSTTSAGKGRRGTGGRSERTTLLKGSTWTWSGTPASAVAERGGLSDRHLWGVLDCVPIGLSCWRRRRCSPLLIPHVRWDIGRTTETKSRCSLSDMRNRPILAQKERTELALDTGVSVYSSIGHIMGQVSFRISFVGTKIMSDERKDLERRV